MKRSRPKGRGSRSSTQKGRKPASAQALEVQARTNIERKLALLVAALKTADAKNDRISDDLPLSRRQFNYWKPLESGGRQLGPNANDTLKRHPDLLSSVEEAVALAKSSRERSEEARPSREERVAAARRAQRIHWTLRIIAERALISSRRELADAERGVVELRAKLKSAEEEFKRRIEEVCAENQTLRDENARLIRDRAKVAPLRRHQ